MQIWRSIPGFAAALLWAALLIRHQQFLSSYYVPASDRLIPALGLCSIASIVVLRDSHRARFGTVDDFFFLLAAMPGVLLLVDGGAALANLNVAPLLRNAGWGMLLLFPGVMLSASPLVRHRLLPGWNQIPALGGFLLPGAAIARNGFRQPGLALSLAVLFGAAWIVLGCAAATKPRS